ncbi:MAG: pyridoxal phosphate-dependent aminotransferase, partial [Clostridium sp.]|nr:pyridoxal phosphate-dependent aminotransferase [Clostridium sp.]
YTENAGLLELRTAIAWRVQEKKGLKADPATEIMVTNGGMEALYLSLHAILDPGDEVIVGSPLFSNYLGEIISCGGVPVCVELKESRDFVIDPAEVERAITPRTKAILLNSPSNPLGSVTGPQVLEQIADLAVRHDLYVLSDEVYEEFNYDDQVPVVSIATLPGMRERTVVIDSFSKTYAMTGWRVGYAVGPEPIIRLMTHNQEGVISSVSACAQYAALEALRGPQDFIGEMIRAFKARRDILVDGIRQVPRVTCRRPKGAFYVFANITGTGMASEEFAVRLLNEAHVAVVPGSAFGPGGEGYIRMSYVVSEDNIREGLRRMAAFTAAI